MTSRSFSLFILFCFFFYESVWFNSFAHDVSKLNRLAPTNSIRFLFFNWPENFERIFHMMLNIVPLTSATANSRWSACIILNARQFFCFFARHLHKVTFLRENETLFFLGLIQYFRIIVFFSLFYGLYNLWIDYTMCGYAVQQTQKCQSRHLKCALTIGWLNWNGNTIPLSHLPSNKTAHLARVKEMKPKKKRILSIQWQYVCGFHSMDVISDCASF